MEEISTNNQVQVYHENILDAMISCDLTYDNNYIICVYFPEKNNINIVVFNKNLELLFTEKLGNTIDFNPNFFIKIAYIKDNSNFI